MASKPSVLIIGAGLAGLAAARHLKNHASVTVLEARNRVGGRTYTDYSYGVPFDHGAFLIHGKDNNPITVLSQQANAHFEPISIDSFAFVNAQTPVTQETLQNVLEQFDQLSEAASSYARQAPADMCLDDTMKAVFSLQTYPALTAEFLNWRSAFIAIYSGADSQYLSARHWDEDEVMLEGGHQFMHDGYSPIVNYLATDIPVILNTEVVNIDYSEEQVKVTTNQGIYTADVVLLTVPLGVLKLQSISFIPDLPIAKQQAIKSLGMGLLDKILLKFPYVFWQAKQRVISYLAPQYKSVSWFINYDHFFKQPVLVVNMAGDLAKRFEDLNDQQAYAEVMQVLREMFGNDIPDAEQFYMTRWLHDPYSGGSYSYIPVGSSGKDFDVIAQTVADKIYFAGEATHRQFFSTAHGAYLSGVREAEKIIRKFVKP